jgi:hypothetical protein
VTLTVLIVINLTPSVAITATTLSFSIHKRDYLAEDCTEFYYFQAPPTAQRTIPPFQYFHKDITSAYQRDLGLAAFFIDGLFRLSDPHGEGKSGLRSRRNRARWSLDFGVTAPPQEGGC